MLPLHLAGNKREVATIYEIVQDADGAAYALPDYQFTCERIWTGTPPLFPKNIISWIHVVRTALGKTLGRRQQRRGRLRL